LQESVEHGDKRRPNHRPKEAHMKRKQKKRAASKTATKAKKTRPAKTAQKRKPARAVKAKARTKPAARAKAKPAAKQVVKAPKRSAGSPARSNGAASTRQPKPEHEHVLEHATLEHEDEGGLHIGGYDESEEFEEPFAEEEEEENHDEEEDY
jgi:hypothetical protein